MEPLVSIIIPVYNVELYLNKCITSVLAQTYKNLEIILIDDGSTDNSGAICDEYSKKDKRFKVIHKINEGPANARNAGLLICSGEYVCFLDSDDWLDIFTIEEAVKAALETNSDIVFWGYIKEFDRGYRKNVRLFNGNSFFDGARKEWLHRRMVGLINEELLYPTKTDLYNSPWGKLYKKSLIINNNIYFISERIIGSEDVLFNIEVFGKANFVYYIDRMFYHYRKYNPTALTKNHRDTLFPRFLNLFKYIENYIKMNNLKGEYQMALNNRISLSIINNSLSITSKGNPENLGKKIKSIKGILLNEVYRTALMRLETKYLPLYWKIFFLLCKLEFAPGVLFLAYIMRMFR